ncbi:MAG TPA: hypothetical protein LFW21_00820 [Rickettsia endosymbiont of Pyrocoelia pectoralis]|nr:hypothetical protein [Rickettsia endosymbiont of Pyrocoelia pectoralis]
MEELVKGKITNARIAAMEEDLIEIIEQQVKLEESIRTEKLALFQKVVEELSAKVENNQAINKNEKDIMQNSIKEIVNKVQILANKTDIETITESVKVLASGKITKARLGIIEEDLIELIEQQSKPNHDVTVNKVTEIIYDKPLLNNQKLLQAAVENKLSSDLIHEAINNNDEELVLAGLLSIGYDVGTIN